jgi:plasmid stabilization system protein ParE
MARIELAPEVLDDLDRFLNHMKQFDVQDMRDRVQEILGSLEVLALSPLIGRPVRDGKRELIIGKGVRGYVALHRYLTEIDTVFILALRAQRNPASSTEDSRA